MIASLVNELAMNMHVLVPEELIEEFCDACNKQGIIPFGGAFDIVSFSQWFYLD